MDPPVDQGRADEADEAPHGRAREAQDGLHWGRERPRGVSAGAPEEPAAPDSGLSRRVGACASASSPTRPRPPGGSATTRTAAEASPRGASPGLGLDPSPRPADGSRPPCCPASDSAGGPGHGGSREGSGPRLWPGEGAHGPSAPGGGELRPSGPPAELRPSVSAGPRAPGAPPFPQRPRGRLSISGRFRELGGWRDPRRGGPTHRWGSGCRRPWSRTPPPG